MHITTTAIRALYDTETDELVSRNIISQQHQDSVLWLNGHGGTISRQHYIKKKEVNAVKDGRYVMNLILSGGVDDGVSDIVECRTDDFAVDDDDDDDDDERFDIDNNLSDSFECEQDEKSSSLGSTCDEDHRMYDNIRENANNNDEMVPKASPTMSRQWTGDRYYNATEEMDSSFGSSIYERSSRYDNLRERDDDNHLSAISSKEKRSSYFSREDSSRLGRSNDEGMEVPKASPTMSRQWTSDRYYNATEEMDSILRFGSASSFQERSSRSRSRYDNLRGNNNRLSGISSAYDSDDQFRRTADSNDRYQRHEKKDNFAEEIEVLRPLPLRTYSSSSPKKEAYVNWTKEEIDFSQRAYEIIYAQLPQDQKRFIAREILKHIRNDPDARKIFHPSHLESSGKFRHVIRTYIENN